MLTTRDTALHLTARTAHSILPKYVSWNPEVDVFARQYHFVTRIDLPGVKREQVTVRVHDGRLTIAGERTTHATGNEEHYCLCEREYGYFYRVIELPDGVLPEPITTTFADGVLEISIPLDVKSTAKALKVGGCVTPTQPAAA